MTYDIIDSYLLTTTTASCAENGKVVGYINKLKSYDAGEIAKIATNHGLYALLTDLLTILIPRIDHSRVVRTFRQIDHIPLIRTYLIAVQHVSGLKLVGHCRSNRTLKSSISKPSTTLTMTY